MTRDDRRAIRTAEDHLLSAIQALYEIDHHETRELAEIVHACHRRVQDWGDGREVADGLMRQLLGLT